MYIQEELKNAIYNILNQMLKQQKINSFQYQQLLNIINGIVPQYLNQLIHTYGAAVPKDVLNQYATIIVNEAIKQFNARIGGFNTPYYQQQPIGGGAGMMGNPYTNPFISQTSQAPSYMQFNQPVPNPQPITQPNQNIFPTTTNQPVNNPQQPTTNFQAKPQPKTNITDVQESKINPQELESIGKAKKNIEKPYITIENRTEYQPSNCSPFEISNIHVKMPFDSMEDLFLALGNNEYFYTNNFVSLVSYWEFIELPINFEQAKKYFKELQSIDEDSSLIHEIIEKINQASFAFGKFLNKFLTNEINKLLALQLIDELALDKEEKLEIESIDDIHDLFLLPNKSKDFGILNNVIFNPKYTVVAKKIFKQAIDKLINIQILDPVIDFGKIIFSKKITHIGSIDKASYLCNVLNHITNKQKYEAFMKEIKNTFKNTTIGLIKKQAIVTNIMETDIVEEVINNKNILIMDTIDNAITFSINKFGIIGEVYMVNIENIWKVFVGKTLEGTLFFAPKSYVES